MPWLSRFHHKKVHTCPPTYTITHALPSVIHHLTRTAIHHAPPYSAIIHHHHTPPYTHRHPPCTTLLRNHTPPSYTTLHAPPSTTHHPTPQSYTTIIHHLTRTAIHHAPPYSAKGLGLPTMNALLIHHLTVMSCNLRRSRYGGVWHLLFLRSATAAAAAWRRFLKEHCEHGTWWCMVVYGTCSSSEVLLLLLLLPWFGRLDETCPVCILAVLRRVP
jgi:hypothetical protein